MTAAILMAALPALSFPSGSDVARMLPELVVGTGFVIGLLIDALLGKKRITWLSLWTFAVLGIALGVTIIQWVQVGNGSYFIYAESFVYDRFGLFIDGLILIAALLVIALSPKYLTGQKIHFGEYYSLILVATAGMMFLGASDSLIMIFLSIEVLSLSLYLLSGFKRDEHRSQEAGFKYFLMGGFASAILLFGMALVFGETGHTQLPQIEYVINATYTSFDPLLVAGSILIFIGLAFKVSAVPFHMWTPDVYEGAPVSVVAFMSVATKVAAFAVLLRLFSVTFLQLYSHWEVAVAATAILSMIVGNVVALRQTNVKRMLAYSSIAQAGYLLIGLAVSGNNAVDGILVYLAGYTFSTFAILAGMTIISHNGRDSDTYADLKGLGYERPLIAAVMAVALLSLAGFPPLIGFWGKFFIFASAVQNGQTVLALWAIATSAVSVFYYVRVIAIMYTVRTESELKNTFANLGAVGAAVLSVSLAAVVGLGLFIPVLYHLANVARAALFVNFLP